MNRREVIAALALSGLTSVARAEPSELCHPTREAMRAIHGLHMPTVEIGSGTGYWLEPLHRAGVEVLGGYDIAPRGPNVVLGDHADAAAQVAPNVAMLAVWPPDGDEVVRWISAAPWSVIVLVGCPGRVKPGLSLDGYKLAKDIALPDGREGENRLRVYRRLAALTA